MSKMTPAQLRELFPATKRACYLNAAASSPISLPVEEAIAGFYREAVEHGDLHFPEWLRRREEVRESLAKFIGAGPKEVAFTASTSFGIHMIGRLLRARGVREVVTLEGEFPSTTLPLLHLGLTLRVVKVRTDGSYALEDIEKAVGPDTGAIIASAVQYASGFRLDLEGVSRICRSRNLRFAVNAAQALGQIPIRVDRIGADFLCATSHKWFFGGHGIGIFYARTELLEDVDLPMGSWLSVENPMAMDNLVGAEVTGRASLNPWFEARGTRFRHDATALEIGAGPMGLILGLGEGLALHEKVGIEETERHNAGLQKLLRAGLRKRGFAPNAPDDPAMGSGICVIPVEGDPPSVVRELVKHGVVLTPRGGGVRISTHAYNSEEDVERLLHVFDSIGVKPKGR